MDKTRVGIPRGLLYYQYFPAWDSFFKNLGFETVLSPETNRGILEEGVSLAVDEICLPFKLYFGHVNQLKEQVDIIFIPRFVRVEKKRTVCPKFLGLPDMVRSRLSGLPEIFSPNIDLGKGIKSFARLVRETSEGLSVSRIRSALALWQAIRELQGFEERMVKEAAFPHQLLPGCCQGDRNNIRDGREQTAGSRPRIALLGHSYLLYDRFLNMGILEKLEGLGLEVLTPELIPSRDVRMGAATLHKDLFWSFNTRILGSAIHLLRQKAVDGIIQLTSFGCGPDSLIGELIERKARRRKVPVMNLNLDEHSGEAGFLTRLEAFTDLLSYRLEAGMESE